ERSPQACGGRDEREVDVEQHGHSDADADAVDRGNDRLRQRRECVEEVREADGRLVVARPGRVDTTHLAEILACREGPPGAGQHDARDVIGSRCRLEGIGRGVIEVLVERVQCFRAVERDHAHATLVQYVKNRHGSTLLRSMSSCSHSSSCTKYRPEVADGQLALQTRATPPVDDEIVIERDAESSGPRLAWLLLIFTVVAVVLTFPNVTRLHSYVPGNSGDALLNLWIVRSVEIALPHGWNAVWNAPIFYPAPNTLAYS